MNGIEWFLTNGIRIIFMIFILIIICIIIEQIVYHIGTYVHMARYSFKDKHVLIIGGLTGLGKEMSKQLIHKCKHLSILDKDKTLLKSTKYEIEDFAKDKKESNVSIVAADICDYIQLQPKVDELTSKEGDVDMVIVNIETVVSHYLFTTLMEEYENAADIYYSLLNVMKIVVPKMMDKNKGEVVIIMPWVALSGYIGYSTVTPMFYAINGYIAVMRNELSKFDGIKIHVAYTPHMQPTGFEVLNNKLNETIAIEENDILYEIKTVSKNIINSIAKGEYNISCGHFTINLLIRLTTGIGNRKNLFLDTIIAPFSVPILWYYNWFRRHEVKRIHENENIQIDM